MMVEASILSVSICTCAYWFLEDIEQDESQEISKLKSYEKRRKLWNLEKLGNAYDMLNQEFSQDGGTRRNFPLPSGQWKLEYFVP